MRARRLRIGVIDLIGKSPARDPYSLLMRTNNTSLMAQVVCVWCQEAGHDVHIAYYSGPAIVAGGLPKALDLLFITAFTQCAHLAYALSALYRSRGVPTVLGGPHARSFPEDAQRYFDYVVGLCDRTTLQAILAEPVPHRPLGHRLSAPRQPVNLPGLRQRWPFLEAAMDKAPVIKVVPIIGSLGCPYTCCFCVDASVSYQPLDFDVMRDDLRFFASLSLRGGVANWQDPNFGIRFDQYLDMIEEAVRPGSITFVAETSLSLLQEPNLRRLRRNGFAFIAPGIESWYEMGGKSRVQRTCGVAKVRRVAEHARMVNAYIPYTQCNVIFGLDSDEGHEPFELTKQFADLAPGVYPHYAILTAFGRNAEGNRNHQADGRVLPVPFEFLDLVEAMNVVPKHYPWDSFYDGVCGAYEHAFSARAIARRAWANRRSIIAFEQVFRSVTSDHFNRLRYHRRMQRWVATDPEVRAFFHGETTTVPTVMRAQVRRHLGPLWEWLPDQSLQYDANAYLHATSAMAPVG